MKRVRGAVALLLFLAVFATAGCSGKMQSRTVYAMDTVFSLSVDGAKEDLDALESVVFQVEKAFSVTDPSSAVSRLNATGECSFGADGAALLRRALALSEETDGAFDITVYPLVRAWGFTTGRYAVPTEEELAALLPLVSYRQVTLDGDVARVPDGVQIDLGGIAKGYLGDRLRALCAKRGISRAILNLGGNVVAVGEKKNGTPWSVAISDADETGYIGILRVSDLSVVTSGAYERYFEKDGVRYGHILDPETGRPATGLLSVTVVGEDGVRCDALSTALFVMGLERAKAFCRSHDVRAVLQDEDGKVYVTRSLADDFTVDARFSAEVIA